MMSCMSFRIHHITAEVAGRLRLLGVDWAEEKHVYNSAAAVAQLLETLALAAGWQNTSI